MKTAAIVVLVAFLLFVVVYSLYRRRDAGGYRARFASRMPKRRSGSPESDDSFVMTPMLFGSQAGSAYDSTHHSPHHAAPDCTPSAGHAGGFDAGGSSCGDGGGSH